MNFSKTIEIEANRKRVWEVMEDLTSWPEWTPTISKVELLEKKPIAVGSRLRIEQPNLPVAVYKIIAWNEGEGFVMVKGNLFLKVSLLHELSPTLQGTRVTLTIVFSGLFSTWVAKRYSAQMEQYLSLETKGLKKQSEALSLHFHSK